MDYLKHWLEYKKGKIELTTWEGYKSIVNNHFVTYFTPLNLTIKEVTPKHIINYYNDKVGNQLRRTNHGLKYSSLRKHSVILKSILNQALLEEIIDRNPALKIPLPKKESDVSKPTFLTASQAQKLLEIFNGHHLKPLIYLTLYYGLRRGEAIGLKWSAIDFKNNTLEINHTITCASTTIAKDKTKTESGKREYIILPEIKEVLILIKAEQKKNKKFFGKSYNKTDYVFTWPDGRPYSPVYVSQSFQKNLKKNDFPHIRFHDLRHSCASILYDKGWDLKDIQTWLGHADIQTTANVYTHISKSRKKIMAKNLENTFTI